jgi:alanyl-tRNA synthetase
MAAAVGGKGGGRPDMAQAGGPNIAGIDNALKMVPDLVSEAAPKAGE